MKRKLVLMIAMLQSASYAFSQKPAIVSGDEKGWYRIGEVTAGFDKETESIIVMGKDEFASIKLRVDDAPVTIERVQIFFEGGKVQEAEVKQPLKAGEETQAIALYAENMEINKVVFTYKTAANGEGEKADVELYGYKAHRDGSGSSGSLGLDAEAKQGDGERSAIEETASDVKKGIGAAASKAASEITDEKLNDMTGPNGQAIFVDENKNYYWIDEEGGRHYVSVLDLKQKN